MATGSGGGGGDSWDGQFKVEPGDLEATAPGFQGVGDYVWSLSELVGISGTGEDVGITDADAAAAWGRFVKVCVTDLQALGVTYSNIGAHLSKGAEAYTKADKTVASKLDLSNS